MVAAGAHGDAASADRPLRRERSTAIKTAREAGAAVRDIYDRNLAGSLTTGGDPSALARQASRAILVERLRTAFPHDVLISDQDALIPRADLATRTWLVEPLDGDREFVEGVPEFVVSIALIEAGRSILAVVYNPINDLLVTAIRGAGVSGGPRPDSPRQTSDLAQAKVLASRTEASRGRWAPFEGAFEVAPTGSTAYRLALVAFSIADAAVSFDPLPAFDACAGALLVEEAGGRVSTLDGRPLDLSRPAAPIAGLLASQEAIYHSLQAVVGVAAVALPGEDRTRASSGPAAVAAPSSGPAAVAAPSTGPAAVAPPSAGSESAAPPSAGSESAAPPSAGSAAVAPPSAGPAAVGSAAVGPAEPGAASPPSGAGHRVTPRITRPESRSAPFVIAAPTPTPPERPRHPVRTAIIYALLVVIGILLGFLAADVTRGTRAGAAAAPASTPSSAGLATGQASTSPVPSESDAPSASPGATLALAAVLPMAPLVATLGDRLAGGGIELDLAWQPPSDGSSVSAYEVRVSSDGGTFLPLDLHRKTARRTTMAAAADHGYAFRLRALGSDGTVGPDAESTVRLATVEESASDLRVSPGWRVARHPAYSGGRARYAKTEGAELSLAFDGSAIAIVGPKGPGRGRAAVFVDGEQVGSFDARAGTFRPVQLLTALDGLAAGPHVMSVRVLGTRGRPMVAIDRFLILEQP